MPIKKSNELDFSKKKINMLLLARPGYGKTTLANSAPRPLLVDWEDGVDRVEACYRNDTISIENELLVNENGEPLKKHQANLKKYQLICNDLKNSDLSCYDTIINDSVGKILDILSSVVILDNSKNAQNDGDTLSIKGYGALASKFKEYMSLVKSLNKHMIWITHVTEKEDGETIKTRVNIVGSTKDNIWCDIDLGGFLDMKGNKRYLCFTPTDKYDAKGTHGITGTYEVPLLKSTEKGGNPEDNHFLSDLFKVFVEDLVSSQKKYSDDTLIYKEAMKIVPRIKAITNVDELNAIVDDIKNVNHALTSKTEITSFFKDKINELGAKYDKEQGIYYVSTEDAA